MVTQSLRQLGISSLCVLTAGFAALSCKDSSGPSGPVPADIQITPNPVQLRQLATVQLLPIVVDKNGNLISGVSVSFASSNAQLVTVSNSGLVASVGPAGTGSISVRAGQVTRTVPVTITAISNGITVTPNPLVMLQKTAQQLDAKVVDLVGAPILTAPINYTSSDPAIVTVSSGGLVTSVGPAGSATITLTSDTLSTLLAVAVTPVPTSISVTPPQVTMARGTTRSLFVQVLDAVGTAIPGAGVTYSSSNTGIVTVSATGTVTSVGPLGSATITVRSGTLSRTVSVSVIAAARPAGVVDATVPLGGAWGVAISSADVVFISQLGSGVSRANLPSRSFTTVISGSSSLASAFNSAGTTAYVAAATSLIVVDVATNAAVGTVGGTGGDPFAVVVSRDNQTVYMSTGSGPLYVIDANTRTIKTSINLGGGSANALALHPNLPKLYASMFDGGAVAEVDLQSNTLVRRIPFSGTPQGIAVSGDGLELYVANEAGRLDFFSLVDGSLVSIPISGGAFGLAVTPDEEEIYVVGGSSIKVVERSSRSLIKTLPAGGDLRRVAINASGSTAVVTDNAGSVIFIR